MVSTGVGEKTKKDSEFIPNDRGEDSGRESRASVQGGRGGNCSTHRPDEAPMCTILGWESASTDTQPELLQGWKDWVFGKANNAVQRNRGTKRHSIRVDLLRGGVCTGGAESTDTVRLHLSKKRTKGIET